MDRYPDGQWDYFRFYQTHFEQTVSDFDADIPATLASIYRRGKPAAVGQLSPTASVTRNGGRYGAAHRAPPMPPDVALWPALDFDALVEAFQARGFRAANAWYLNDTANLAYARAAPNEGCLSQPVLYIDGDWDPICDINRSRVGEPMSRVCQDLSLRASRPVTGCHSSARSRASKRSVRGLKREGSRYVNSAKLAPDLT